jgi:formylglycine-generating enzyme required for sulfatase activity
MWDVFISHAWEDKEEVARPLAEAMRRAGLRVWYDEFTLTLGDSLRRSIDHGLAQSRYGIVVLTPHFFAKEWPQRELDGLVAKEVSSGKTILPVWHNVTWEDVNRFSPTLADKLAVSTAKGLDAVIEEILRVLREEHRPRPRPVVTPIPAKPRWPVNWKIVRAIAGIGLLIALGVWLSSSSKTPTVTPTRTPFTPTVSPTFTPTSIPPTPEATVTPVPTEAQTGRTIHRVQPGENLSQIAQRYGVSVEAIMEVNHLENSDLIYTGQLLLIPASGEVFPTATPTFTPTPPTPTPTDVVYVPAGEFLMGLSKSDLEAIRAISSEVKFSVEGEEPQHEVFLDAFYIDKYEVTNAQYRKCVEADACDKPRETIYYDDADYAQHPVVYVDWYQAKAYCEWANKRLLTEAEWEKAARSDEERTWPWGNTFDGKKVNFCDKNCLEEYRDNSVDDGYAYTAPVGSYLAGVSPYGALDMAGNVWEWVADWYDPDYYSQSPARNPPGPDSGSKRVVRGGAWHNGFTDIRTSYRFSFSPTDRGIYLGFRCAR